MTFSALAVAYLRDRSTDGQRRRTAESYNAVFGQSVEFVHRCGLKDDVRHFDPENVGALKTHLLERGCKPSTVANRLAALSSLG